MHTMHTFYFFFYNPLYSKGFRGVEGMRCLMHTARIPMHTTGFSQYWQKTGLSSSGIAKTAPHPVPWRGIGCGAGNPPL